MRKSHKSRKYTKMRKSHKSRKYHKRSYNRKKNKKTRKRNKGGGMFSKDCSDNTQMWTPTRYPLLTKIEDTSIRTKHSSLYWMKDEQFVCCEKGFYTIRFSKFGGLLEDLKNQIKPISSEGAPIRSIFDRFHSIVDNLNLPNRNQICRMRTEFIHELFSAVVDFLKDINSSKMATDDKAEYKMLITRILDSHGNTTAVE